MGTVFSQQYSFYPCYSMVHAQELMEGHEGT